MRGLFLKIFLCFWLSHTLAVVLVFAVTTAMQAQRNEPTRGNFSTLPPSQTLAQYAQNAVTAMQRGGNGTVSQQKALHSYLDDIQRSTGLHYLLLDAKGAAISDDEVSARVRNLSKRAAESGELEVSFDRGGLVAARRARSSNDQDYILVAELPRRGGRQPTNNLRRAGESGNSPSNRTARRQMQTTALLLALFLAAGIVSYGLARYLTAPTIKLRQATYQLASGDLSTRVGSQMGRRRDELADLGRDFDLMAERIQSLMQSERRLLGDISHELRSPLARLQVALDLASQTADAETRGFLERIEREAGRLNGLIGHLLTLTRLEIGGSEARREAVHLTHLVNEVAADADFEARGQNRSVQILHAAECTTTGNAELLRSAVENVVRNAVRYTSEGTTVEITLQCQREEGARSTPGSRKARQQAIIRVRDYGPGVPPESLEHLFRAFYRVADARDRQSGGVGLGLSITARAVNLHGGEVSAANADGGGLLVEIRIPVADSKDLPE